MSAAASSSRSSSRVPSPTEATQTILKGRKCYRVSKDKNEVVWPPHLEAALMEGARCFQLPRWTNTHNAPPLQASTSTSQQSPSRRAALLGSLTATSSSPSTSTRRQERPGPQSRWEAVSSSSGTQRRARQVSSLTFRPSISLLRSGIDHTQPCSHEGHLRQTL